MTNSKAAETSQQKESLRGFGIFLCALLLLATLDAIAKDVVQRYPAPLINMIRYGVVLLMATSLMLGKGYSLTLNSPQRKLLVWRGVMLGLVGNTFMPALQFMPLAEATAIYFVSPLIIVALSPWLLGERVSVSQWLASAAGFGGMLLIVRPSSNLPLVGCLLMGVAAFSYAMVQILTRKLAGKVDMEQQFFYTAVICTAMTAIPAMFYLPQQLPPARDMLLLLLVGVLSGFGQYLLIKAFQKAPASALAPFNYFHLLLAVIFSIVVFGQQPGITSLAGMLIIACAGLWLTLPVFGTYVTEFAGRRVRENSSAAALVVSAPAPVKLSQEP